LPLPTQPPYTAFVGNLAFDLTEHDLETFFDGLKTKSVKVIKDRDERPKGFGYVEFEELEDLKGALTKTGSTLAGRTVRVSVAEPPKERAGFGGFDDPKFSGDWRRQGPLPDLDSRDSSRRRYDGPPSDRQSAPTSVSDTSGDWRSNRPTRAPPPEAEATVKRKNSAFGSEGGGAADKEETWTIGGKFKPSEDEGPGRKFGSYRGRGDMGPPSSVPPDSPAENDWRSGPRPGISSRNSTSPTSSTPPTPQLTRRKLELLPRSGNTSSTPSPLASPKMAQSNPANRPSPFGAAKPVDVTAREKVIAERLDKDREATKERVGEHSMSRTNSRQGADRSVAPRSPPVGRSGDLSLPPSPRATQSPVASIRSTFSFAAAAGGKRDGPAEDEPKVTDISEQLGEVTI
jgi:translation initiation factor 4B